MKDDWNMISFGENVYKVAGAKRLQPMIMTETLGASEVIGTYQHGAPSRDVTTTGCVLLFSLLVPPTNSPKTPSDIPKMSKYYGHFDLLGSLGRGFRADI